MTSENLRGRKGKCLFLFCVEGSRNCTKSVPNKACVAVGPFWSICSKVSFHALGSRPSSPSNIPLKEAHRLISPIDSFCKRLDRPHFIFGRYDLLLGSDQIEIKEILIIS